MKYCVLLNGRLKRLLVGTLVLGLFQPSTQTGSAQSLPIVTIDAPAVAVDEGQLASNAGTFADPDAGDIVTVDASVGAISQNGTSGGVWEWSYRPTDGLEDSQTVPITAESLRNRKNLPTSFRDAVRREQPRLPLLRKT